MRLRNSLKLSIITFAAFLFFAPIARATNDVMDFTKDVAKDIQATVTYRADDRKTLIQVIEEFFSSLFK